MLYNLCKAEHLQKIVLMIAMLFGFFFTVYQTRLQEQKLPKDAGREFAHDGKLSAGKPRGAGIIFIHIFNGTAFLLLPMKLEYVFYLILIQACMLMGYMDDAASEPWSRVKKGVLDLVIAVLVTANYIFAHGTDIRFAIFHTTMHVPVVIFALASVALIWASINVTNCADGVDGLSGMLTCLTLMGFSFVMQILGTATDFLPQISLFIMCLLAYLWFNAPPSRLMMGDAGSRAMGLMIAICALLCEAPLLYLLLAFVLMMDGGLGLLKVTLIKTIHVHILKDIRTPLHDHVRKNMGWSNTQCVFRFSIIQIVIMVAVLFLIRIM